MIKDVSPALARQCFKLISVGGSYHKKNGAPFHLLQEYRCQLVINIILVNIKQQTMSHFIAWDGSRLHDQGYVSIVNTIDRSNEEESNKVFEELYNKRNILSWQTSKVHELVGL